jgi:hypothetical protein
MEQGEKELSAESRKKTRSCKAKRPRKSGQSSQSRKSRKSKAELVGKVIENLEQKLEANELKPSVGDLIRLLQLERELEAEQPREIKVSWVEPREEEHAGEK